jgi:hypothetical protein
MDREGPQDPRRRRGRDRGARRETDQPGQGPVPEDRLHQGAADQLLRSDCARPTPHLHNRPLTLKRYPNGVEGEFFYEKQSPNPDLMAALKESLARVKHS